MGIKLFERFKKKSGETISFNGISYRVFDRFVTSQRETISLLEGFRDELKPDWRSMLVPTDFKFKMPEKDALKRRADANIRKIKSLGLFLEAFGISLKNKVLLEVGCDTGATADALSLLKPGKIVGSDISKYYIHQSPGHKVTKENEEKQFNFLTREREAMMEYFMESGSVELCSDISFIEDDINRSNLPDRSFDFILSYEVMEHVKEPVKAISEMHRLLKPGGITFFEYNPFFCLEGGHSLCTLDFPWGHARLTKEDFVSYTNKFRPNEAEVDQSFYFNNLNRMTISDMKNLAEKTGFEIIDILTRTQDLLSEILKDDRILSQTRQINPSAALSDLLTDRVWVLMRRKI